MAVVTTTSEPSGAFGIVISLQAIDATDTGRDVTPPRALNDAGGSSCRAGAAVLTADAVTSFSACISFRAISSNDDDDVALPPPLPPPPPPPLLLLLGC